MKELSIEQKAKRYDEAIEVARKIKNGEPINVPDGTPIPVAIFPELKESEDERIRKALIEHFAGSHSSMYPYEGFTKKQILAWLEKQGEQKPVVPKFRVGDIVKYTNFHGEPIYKICSIDSQCYICFAVGDTNLGDKGVMHFSFDNPYLRLVEQKPVDWSDEDENMLNLIIARLHSNPNVELEEYGKLYGWLNSRLSQKLSNIERNGKNWKPTEEQMEALDFVIDCTIYPEFQDKRKALKGLFEQLKEL